MPGNRRRRKNGWNISFDYSRTLRAYRITAEAFRKSIGGNVVEMFYWIGGIAAFVLLIYLFVALLKPEVFS
jgi:K+-transporting ATPase KdpF subunit